jgi:phosphotransferase system  glucose/maltose/N-acetylglucosamine-specific IIC component
MSDAAMYVFFLRKARRAETVQYCTCTRNTCIFVGVTEPTWFCAIFYNTARYTQCPNGTPEESSSSMAHT